MKKLLKPFTLAASLAIAGTSTALANMCAPADEIKNELEQEFDETIIFNGTTSTFVNTPQPDGTLAPTQIPLVMSLYFNQTTGSYTIIATDPYGTSCIMGAGSNGSLGPVESMIENPPQGIEREPEGIPVKLEL